MTPRQLAIEPSFALAWRWIEGRCDGATGGEALRSRLTCDLRNRALGREKSGAISGAQSGARPGVGALPLHPERVDPTWYVTLPSGAPAPVTVAFRVALGALPKTLCEAVCQAGGFPLTAPLRPDPWLCQAAARGTWAHLADMPPELSGPPGGPQEEESAAVLALGMAALPADTIHSAVVWAGVPPLGALMRHLPDRAAAGLCGRFPEPLRAALWMARRGVDKAPPAPPTRQELVRLHAELHQPDPARLLFSLGARLWAAFLVRHGERALRPVAQALPASAGRLLLEAPPCEPPPRTVVALALSRTA